MKITGAEIAKILDGDVDDAVLELCRELLSGRTRDIGTKIDFKTPGAPPVRVLEKLREALASIDEAVIALEENAASSSNKPSSYRDRLSHALNHEFNVEIGPRP